MNVISTPNIAEYISYPNRKKKKQFAQGSFSVLLYIIWTTEEKIDPFAVGYPETINTPSSVSTDKNKKQEQKC